MKPHSLIARQKGHIKPLRFLMQQCLILCGCVLYVSAIAAAQNVQAEAVEIPLDTILGYKMPRTNDLQKVKDRRAVKLIEAIRAELSTLPSLGKEADEGFAVIGTGLSALDGVHSVLVEGSDRPQSLPSHNDVTLVFFSFQFGAYVHLDSVMRRGDTIEIRYKFVPHKSLELTEHFALIPVGRFTPGEVQVEVIQMPMDDEFVTANWKPIKPEFAKRIVCKSFAFVVQ